MATTSFNGKYEVDWDFAVSNQSVSGNWSDVYGRLIVRRTGGPSWMWAAAAPAFQINGFGATITGNWGPYDFNSRASYTLWEGTRRFSHNADGTLTISTSAAAQMYNVSGGIVTGTVNLNKSMPTIARASVATWQSPGDATAGVAKRLLTNRASSAFTHRASWTIGSLNQQTTGLDPATGITTGFDVTFPLTVFNQYPGSTRATGTINLDTYSGSTRIGSRQSSVAVVLPDNTSTRPSINSVSAVDDNPTVASVVGAFVQSLSLLKATVNASGKYGATISTRTFKVGSVTANSGGVIPLTGAGSVPVTASVTDSRGRTTTGNYPVTVLPYSAPNVVSATVRRVTTGNVLSDTGSALRLTLNASVQSLVNGTQRNAMTIRVFTRQKGATAWTARNVITPGLTYNTSVLIAGGGVFSPDSSWEVRVDVSDKFLGSSNLITVATAAVTMHWDRNRVGIGKMWEQGTLDVGGPIYVNGVSVNSADSITSGRFDIARVPNIHYNASNGRAYIGTDPANPISNTSNFLAISPDSDTGIHPFRFFRNNSSTILAITDEGNLVSSKVPFAMAAGRVTLTTSGISNGDSVSVTVTLPAGRFTREPIITVSTSSSRIGVQADTRSTSSFRLLAGNFSGAHASNGAGDPSGTIYGFWQAVQMTSGSATG